MKRFLAYILASALVMPQTLLAVSPSQIGQNACNQAGSGAIGCGGPGIFDSGGFFGKVISLVIFIVGAVSVLMIVIGALRYTLSGGDQAGIRSAKDTILYALVGLVLAVLAYGIVAFVLKSIG